MSELSNSELRRLDLTVLLIFLGLLRHGKGASVASELGLTQSAISQALRRLREIFRDDLFLRRPHGMEPTARARALEAPISQAVDALRQALGAADTFDPTSAEGVVRVAAVDAEQASIIPRLAALLMRQAPGLQLAILPLGRTAALEALKEGRIDLFLGYAWDVPANILGERLYDVGFLVAGNPEALPNAPDLDLDTYCAAEHILVSPGGDLRGLVDERLERIGRQRRVRLILPAFLSAPAAAAASNALVTLPSTVARSLASGFGLVLCKPPLELRRFDVSVFWHRRNDQGPKTIWLRSQLRASVPNRDDPA